MAVVLGLLVALTYGSGDFLGGIASKRNAPVVVVAVSQAFGLSIMVVLVAIERAEPIGADLLAGACAGSVGLVGVVLLYRGLAGGAMGVIAPITAVGAAVVPFTWGVLTGDRPSGPALAGVAVALVAVVLVSSSDEATERHTSRQDLLLAVGAGAAFGFVFLLLGITGEEAGMWPVLAARVASVSIVMTVVLVGRRGLRVAPGTRSSIIGAGVFDAGANALYLLAVREGLLSLVSVLSSLYPAATVVLASSFLGEGIHRKQLLGILLALSGVALIARG